MVYSNKQIKQKPSLKHKKESQITMGSAEQQSSQHAVIVERPLPVGVMTLNVGDVSSHVPTTQDTQIEPPTPRPEEPRVQELVDLAERGQNIYNYLAELGELSQREVDLIDSRASHILAAQAAGEDMGGTSLTPRQEDLARRFAANYLDARGIYEATSSDTAEELMRIATPAGLPENLLFGSHAVEPGVTINPPVADPIPEVTKTGRQELTKEDADALATLQGGMSVRIADAKDYNVTISTEEDSDDATDTVDPVSDDGGENVWDTHYDLVEPPVSVSVPVPVPLPIPATKSTPAITITIPSNAPKTSVEPHTARITPIPASSPVDKVKTPNTPKATMVERAKKRFGEFKKFFKDTSLLDRATYLAGRIRDPRELLSSLRDELDQNVERSTQRKIAVAALGVAAVGAAVFIFKDDIKHLFDNNVSSPSGGGGAVEHHKPTLTKPSVTPAPSATPDQVIGSSGGADAVVDPPSPSSPPREIKFNPQPGEGYTDQIHRRAKQLGVHLTDRQEFVAYDKIEKKGGISSRNSYRMADGNRGISDPGRSVSMNRKITDNAIRAAAKA